VRIKSPVIFGCLIVGFLAALTPSIAEAQRYRPAPPGRAVSTAVPRGSVRPPYASPRYYHPGYGRYYYPRSYYPGYYYPRYYYPGFYPGFYYPGFYPGFSFSVGFGFGYGYGYGYGGYPYYGYAGYPWGYYGGYAPIYYDNSSSLRLQVTPRDAEVYVDGHLAGRVDSFDGTFQRLHVEPGAREITVYHDQYRPFTEKLYVSPREGYKIQRAMQPLGPGETAPPRPAPAASSSPRQREERMSRYPDRGYPEQSAFGTLSIRVQPMDAEIYVDGERWEFSGSRERLVIELSEGPHRLEIRKEGLEPYVTTVHVRPGEAATINVSLTKGSGAAAPRTNSRPGSTLSVAGVRRSAAR
jgi:PEGA domain